MKQTLTVAGAFGLVLALGCGPALAQDQIHSLGTPLLGINEVGHEGAGEEAGGDFSGEIDMGAGTLCFYLDVYGLDDMTAAHMHNAPEGENGPPVMVLEIDESGDEACAEADAELLADIAQNEENYYVNVHTQTLPAGAIRGQFGG